MKPCGEVRISKVSPAAFDKRSDGGSIDGYATFRATRFAGLGNGFESPRGGFLEVHRSPG